VQARVFSLIGLSPEEAQAKFGYLLDSFEVQFGLGLVAVVVCGVWRGVCDNSFVVLGVVRNVLFLIVCDLMCALVGCWVWGVWYVLCMDVCA